MCATLPQIPHLSRSNGIGFIGLRMESIPIVYLALVYSGHLIGRGDKKE